MLSFKSLRQTLLALNKKTTRSKEGEENLKWGRFKSLVWFRGDG